MQTNLKATSLLFCLTCNYHADHAATQTVLFKAFKALNITNAYFNDISLQ